MSIQENNFNEKFQLSAKLSNKTVENFKESILTEIVKKYSNRIDSTWNEIIENYKKIEVKNTSKYFFTSFAPMDFHIGNTFNYVIYENKKVNCKSEIVAILNEWAFLPMESVPLGHRCVCLIDFPDGIPSIIENMPQVEKATDRNLIYGIYLCN